VFQRDGHVFAAKAATIQVPETGRARGSQGEQHWMAENPPHGAVITYWIREAPRTLRQRRQDAARAAEQKKATPAYPTQAEITAEEDEEAPQTLLTISDGSGRVVRRLTVAGARGMHRVTWDLRGPAVTLPGGDGGPGGGGGGFGGQGGLGAFVQPGTYRVALSRRAGGTVTALGEAQTVTVSADPGVTLTPEQRTAAVEYQTNVFRLQRSFTGALEQANQMRTRTQAMRRAITESAADIKLLDAAVGFDRRVLASLRALRGDETLRGLESGSPSSIQTRVNSAAAGARGLTGAPTGTQQTNYTIALEDLNAEIGRLKALEGELRKFETQLEAAGVPYTPGRWPQ
jgi:hypothetical protein